MTREIKKKDRYAIITNGFGIIQGPIHNQVNQETTSGQPFMIVSNTEEKVIDLFFSEYSIKYVDDEGNQIDRYGNAYTEETCDEVQKVAIKRPIDWDINYTIKAQAQDVCDKVMIASNNYFFITPIKHPTLELWATPYQDYILNSLQESTLKNTLISLSNYSINKGNRRAEQQMIDEGWHNGA